MKYNIRHFGLTGIYLLTAVGTSMGQAVPAGISGTNSNVAPIPPSASKTDSQQMAPIIVTGSLIPTTDSETASPVVVVDSATIQKRGYQTVTDIVKNLPSNGSFSSPGRTSGAFAAGASYVSLRGLGPQATLVLINGRRVADYAASANGQYGFVDLNNIPAQIVDRVEVLTDGTALYGADAVAGVVNIITKKDLGDDNGLVDAYIGNTTHKDAFDQRYTAMGSLSSFDKNGYGIVEVDYEHQNSIAAVDRSISQSANQTSNGGVDLRSGRTYPGIFIGDDTGDFFSILPRHGNVPLNGTTNAADPAVDDGATALQGFDYNKDTTILPETERYGVYMNYTYKFYDGNIVPNIDFDYRHNRTILNQAAAGWNVNDLNTAPNNVPGLGNAFTVPTTNPYNNTGQQIDIFSYRFTDIGPRIEKVDSDVFRAVPQVDFKLGDGWTLNVGVNLGYNFVDDRGIGFPSAAIFQEELNGTTLATAYNPFTSAGQNRQQLVQNLIIPEGNRSTYSMIGEDFRFNGKLFDLPAGPVQVAIGGEYRLERFNQDYSAEDQTNDVIGSSRQSNTAASRKALSGYTEVDIPLTSPSFNIPGCYAIDILVDGRVDKYNQFGSTENPQVRLRWETIPGLVLRGGYAKSFRAPSLSELYAGSHDAVGFVVDPVAGAHDVTVTSVANPNLKPETAETFSAGVAYSPEAIKGLLLTADYFKIRYNNQILQQDPQTLVDEGSPQVTLNPVDGSVAEVQASYSNTASSYIEGIDWGARYVIGDPYVNYGQFTFSIDATYLRKYVLDDGTGAGDIVGQDSGGVGPYSRYRQDASVTWDFHNFSFTLSNDYSSGYHDSTAAADLGIDRNVASICTFDAQMSYTFDKQEMSKWAPLPKGDGFDWRQILAGTRISVGCNNLYDFSPPFTANDADTLGYDEAYADGVGRFVYAELTKKF